MNEGAEPGAMPELEEVANRLAIQAVLARHSRGVDRAVEADLRACYWDDATVAYGGINGPAQEFCAILPQAIRGFDRTAHVVSNTLIDFNADQHRAAVESYVTAYHYRADPAGDQDMIFLGRYLDRFERRGSVWRISHRQVVMDWNLNQPATAIHEGPPFDGLARGARAPEDPLYAMLAEQRAGQR
ncbi:MAG: nuclear transport factor 2 family protein [Pseudomonadota bacterium]